MISTVIGIISYMPEDESKRNSREQLLLSLLFKCNEIFDLPIYIIAQNWSINLQNKIKSIPNCQIEVHDKALGIAQARETLRKSFLKLAQKEDDVIIFLDDDCILKGDSLSGNRYLQQIYSHPNCFYEVYRSVLKLFAISKSILSEVSFPDISVENGDGFEDRVFYNFLLKKFPSRRYVFSPCGVVQRSVMTGDKLSTWYKNQDIGKMLANTKLVIEKIKS